MGIHASYAKTTLLDEQPLRSDVLLYSRIYIIETQCKSHVAGALNIRELL